MRKLFWSVIVVIAVAIFLPSVADADPAWYACSVAWAGAGGGGVYIVLVNPAFPTTLGPTFPSHSIMVSGGAGTVQANRILATALSAFTSGSQVMVYTEPASFTAIGGLYIYDPSL